MQVKNEILVRIYIVLSVIVLFALVIFFQAIKVTLFEKDKWLAKAEQFHVKSMSVSKERGNILSHDGSLLSTSLPYYDIRFDPLTSSITDKIFWKNVDSLALCLSYYVDRSLTPGGMKQKLIDARTSGDRYLLIKKNANHLELERIKQFPLFRRGRYKGGLIVEKKPKRERPFGILAHRTIGYVREGANPVGLEGKFDKVLGGQAGERLMRKIKGMNGETIWIPADDFTYKQINGKDIKTTIDINLQDITEEALLRGLQKNNAKYGTAIMMEVETGAIRAIANLDQTENGWWERFNYAIGQTIEPGSTFKLASAMALLENNLIDLDDTVQLHLGKYEFYDEEMVDASYHALEESTFRKAFEISSNVGIALTVDEKFKNDPQKFVNQLKDFNLDLPTGIEIDGEVPPYIKESGSEEDDWSGITLPWMSIGYELSLTPLQLLTFYNAVANDGKMMKPYLVEELMQYGVAQTQFKPTVVDKSIASPSTIAKAKELLEGVVDEGTAKKLKTNVYNFAGKTGTAQVNYSRRGQKMKHQASFAGYFPAENPKYSIMVVVNDPKQGSYYGSDVAGPIFREIADKAYASKFEIQPTMNQEEKPSWRTYSLPDLNIGEKRELAYLLRELEIPFSDNSINQNWSVTKAKNDTLSLLSRNILPEVIPNVKGMGLRDAIYILENKGLKVTVSGFGKVKRQSVPAGRTIKGQTVHLTLS